MKRVLLLSCLSGLLFMSQQACSKGGGSDPDPVPPVTNEVQLATVKTDSAGVITTSTATVFSTLSNNGGGTITERGVVYGKAAAPTDNKTQAVSYTTSQFRTELKNLEPNTTYYVRSFATNSKGIAYSADVQFKTMAVPAAVMFTDTMFAAGSSTIFVAGKVVDAKGITSKETGICISKTANPTIADRKVMTASPTEQNIFLRINDLEQLTDYYIRAYTTTVYGNTEYGASVKVSTIKKGNVKYTLVQEPNPTDEQKAAYARIKAAFDEAVEYYNNYTSIEKTLTVNYNTGVATADASINGNIRVGSNTGYQKTGTALHEMAHAVGVGQHWMWASQFIQGGVYQGVWANKLLQFMTRGTETIKGDALHFWPYGINGANEDNGAELLYLTNVFIVQGMKKDGLPSSY